MKKTPTGMPGFDALTGGGLPSGRATLIEGGAGTGKTVFALQALVHGARALREPGIFVAFEESAKQITTNAGTFGWDIPALERDHLFFLDAQPHPDLLQSGDFDLSGMLAALEAKVAEMGAKRIVFDAMDIVLALARDTTTVRREAYRLHQWLMDQELTAIITSKVTTYGSSISGSPPLDFLQFMVDTVIRLHHDLFEGVAQRNLRVDKYRGSDFDGNATPFLFGDGGIELAYSSRSRQPSVPASSERLSSGIGDLDQMLGGGYFRGACVLITGAPGTAKTTLCGSFAEASCKLGDRTVFVSFDSRSDEIIRNLQSVAIALQPQVETGMLRLVSKRALDGSAETHLMRIKSEMREHGARCLIIDPLSALSKSGNRSTAPSVAERLVDWAKSEGVTVVCTSLLDDEKPEPAEGTPLQISTIADTWIHMNYLVHAGERNRGLSIIKSRGTGHSNQVRELILSDMGPTLSDVYTAGGEVLMGSMRWAREREEKLEAREREVAFERQQQRLNEEKAEIQAQIDRLGRQLEAKFREEETLEGRTRELRTEQADTHQEIRNRRLGRSESKDL